VKILIVDDARWQRLQLTKVLVSAGHDVVEASNGREALRALEAGVAPEVIVCDLLMPELDGFGFLAELRERGGAVPVVIASADIQRTSRARCEMLGASGFVAKPYTAEMILAAVGAAVAVGVETGAAVGSSSVLAC